MKNDAVYRVEFIYPTDKAREIDLMVNRYVEMMEMIGYKLHTNIVFEKDSDVSSVLLIFSKD